MNTVLLFIVVLGPLIFFHELGHFLVARLFGVGVEKFSLGFGPRILGKKIGRTDYRLSLIPLGGFVKMVGDEPDSDLSPEDIPYSFTHKHVAKRSLIVFAGPFFNAVLALIIFMVIFYFIGISSIRPVIKNIDADSHAEKAGLQIDDRIVSIDNKTVESWRDINTIFSQSKGAAVNLQIMRQAEALQVELVPQKAAYIDVYRDEIAYFDFGIAGRPQPSAIIGAVLDKTPAYEAGLLEGDVIISIDGRPIRFWKEMQKIVTGSDGKKLHFKVKRQNETLDVQITPQLVKDRDINGISSENYRIGIARPPDVVPDVDKITIKLGFLESFQQSVRIIVEITNSLFDFIKKAFKGKVSREMVGGPIRIAQMAHQSAQMGLIAFFSFVAAISLQLAILNLLPIPVLDGGHLLFYGIEAIKRGPLSVRARETAQQVGLFLLLLLMIFVLYNDIEFTWFN